jgi:hypothetical protein
MKREVNETRRASRNQSRARGEALLANGQVEAARDAFRSAVDITPAMAHAFLEAARADGVECIVAPYEADAQLAFLARSGQVEAVLTEDSDLLAFGAPRVLFKMDKYGACREILLADLARCPEPSFAHWSEDMFRWMCILAGCDYAPAIGGLGVRRAHKLLHRYRQIERVFRVMRADRSLSLPRGYEARFRQADLTFRYQRVWDPREGHLTHVSPLPEALAALPAPELAFLGPDLEPNLARRLAEGALNPATLEPFPPSSLPPLSPPAAAAVAVRAGRVLSSSSPSAPAQKPLKQHTLLSFVSRAARAPFKPPRFASAPALLPSSASAPGTETELEEDEEPWDEEEEEEEEEEAVPEEDAGEEVPALGEGEEVDSFAGSLENVREDEELLPGREDRTDTNELQPNVTAHKRPRLDASPPPQPQPLVPRSPSPLPRPAVPQRRIEIRSRFFFTATASPSPALSADPAPLPPSASAASASAAASTSVHVLHSSAADIAATSPAGSAVEASPVESSDETAVEPQQQRQEEEREHASTAGKRERESARPARGRPSPLSILQSIQARSVSAAGLSLRLPWASPLLNANAKRLSLSPFNSSCRPTSPYFRAHAASSPAPSPSASSPGSPSV